MKCRRKNVDFHRRKHTNNQNGTARRVVPHKTKFVCLCVLLFHYVQIKYWFWVLSSLFLFGISINLFQSTILTMIPINFGGIFIYWVLITKKKVAEKWVLILKTIYLFFVLCIFFFFRWNMEHLNFFHC